MKVTVYHNLSWDASSGLNTVCEVWPGAQPGSPAQKRQGTGAERHGLVKVFEFGYGLSDPGKDDFTVCEDLFWEFNVADDPLFTDGVSHPVAQAYRARKLRSLSTGDVIRIGNRQGDRFYSVGSAGFTSRQPGELRIVDDLAEAEKLIRERYGFAPGEPLSITVPLDGK